MERFPTLIFLLLTLTIIPNIQCSDPESGYPLFLFNCSKDGNYTPHDMYQYYLYNLLGNLSSQAASPDSDGFYYATIGQGNTQVYASYLCRGDVSHHTCSECVTNATNTVVNTCPYQLGAAIWYIECMFQYSDTPYWGVIQDRFSLKMWNSSRNMSDSEAAGYGRKVDSALNGLATLAVNDTVQGRMYATWEGDGLYTLAQCRPDLSREHCAACLNECIGNVTRGMIGGMVIYPSCNIRFETYRFYAKPTTPIQLGPSGTPEGEPAKSQSSLLPFPLIISAAVVVAAILVSGLWICLSPGEWKDFTTAKSLQFDFSDIRASTNNFSFDRKLGEGGFGPVYKGRLPNGQEVAVKRLSKNSGQGIKEFKNEVLLVAKLQHRNLVKLIGFCISGQEIALIYEFLPNSSLDKLLSDASNKEYFNWEIRFKIICGIAKGLMYLHDDSRLKIIHRDLKSSNILLDEAMNPKISDFGLARLFGVDQTQDDTNRIVGTYGYMAPEYAMTGHFSTKSDVYSLGVIVLEILSGQKNRFYTRSPVEEALLLRAWRLWKEERVLDLVDPSLENKYSREQASKCIEIGLLCIQESPLKRPNMSSIVASLSGQHMNLSSPVPPNFFNTSSSTWSSSIGSDEAPYLPRVQLGKGLTRSFSGTEDITNISPR